MPRPKCPHCQQQLPYVGDAFCPYCSEDLHEIPPGVCTNPVCAMRVPGHSSVCPACGFAVAGRQEVISIDEADLIDEWPRSRRRTQPVVKLSEDDIILESDAEIEDALRSADDDVVAPRKPIRFAPDSPATSSSRTESSDSDETSNDKVDDEPLDIGEEDLID